MQLGDKIRDAIVGKLGKPNEKKADAMQRAADMLKMSKSSLYGKLNENPIPVDLLEKLHRIIGINISELKREQMETVEATDSGHGKDKLLTIPVKNRRVVRVYMPDDYDKDDLRAMVDQINLWQKNF